MSRRIPLLLALLLTAVPASAAVRFIKWNHANGSGDERSVAAIDLDSGKAVWEKKLKQRVPQGHGRRISRLSRQADLLARPAGRDGPGDVEVKP